MAPRRSHDAAPPQGLFPTFFSDSPRSADPQSREGLFPTLFPFDVQEGKAFDDDDNHNNITRSTSESRQKKMSSVRGRLLILSVCLLVLFGLASAATPSSWTWPKMPCRGSEGGVTEQMAESKQEPFSLSSLLGAASPKPPHQILHHEPESKAVEAGHRADAAFVTSPLQLAKRDNSTTSTPLSDSTTSSDLPTTTSTDETTSSTSSTSERTTSSPSPSAPTSSPTPTTTPSTTPSSSSGTSSTDVDSSSSSSESGSSSSFSSSSSSITSSTSRAVTSSLDDGETTFTTSTQKTSDSTTSTSESESESTSSSSSSRSMRIVLETHTTTSNGEEVVVTATSYVDAGPLETDAAAATTTRQTPTLQNAGSKQGSGGGMVLQLLAGALAGRMLI